MAVVPKMQLKNKKRFFQIKIKFKIIIFLKSYFSQKIY